MIEWSFVILTIALHIFRICLRIILFLPITDIINEALAFTSLTFYWCLKQDTTSYSFCRHNLVVAYSQPKAIRFNCAYSLYPYI